jgi:dihydrofolate synthase/folylpolyglutamate synthase
MATTQRSRTLQEWLRTLESQHPKKIDLGLDRIQTVLRALSIDHPAYRVIAVGGTNGKGSCVAMLESIYREAGYRVGTFTSPHIWRFNERIRLGGMEVTDEELIELFAAIDEARGGTTLSYFEYSAVAALLFFTRGDAEIAVLEVGLGGRLDAVNAVQPDASLIVSVSLDHQHWLGNTRDVIGREKAGIARSGKSAVIADREPPEGLLEAARAVGAELRLIGRDFDRKREGSLGSWSYQGRGSVITGLPMPSFGGGEQADNAAACVAVVESLGAILPVDRGAIARGIGRAELRARIERRDVDGVEWVFDVAHNPAATGVLSAALQRDGGPRRTLAVVGIMGDKDVGGVLEPLIPIVDQWILTQAETDRGAPPEVLRTALAARDVVGTCVRPNVVEACRAAQSMSRPGDRVVVFGSFYLVGPAMSALGLYCAPSQPGDVSARWTAD